MQVIPLEADLSFSSRMLYHMVSQSEQFNSSSARRIMPRSAGCGDSGVLVDLKTSDECRECCRRQKEISNPELPLKRVSRFGDKFPNSPANSAKEVVGP
jgi:hypothetical protein